MSLENAKYMKGTEGKPEYLILAEEGDLRLGVKGYSKPGPGGAIALVLRIRTQHASKDEVVDKTEFVNAWPINFEKLSTRRASCELFQLVNQSQLQLEKICKAANKARFASKAFDFFENIGVHVTCPREDVIAHLNDQWFGNMKKMINEAEPEFILSTFVDVNVLKKNAPEGLTIDIFGVKLNGEKIVYPTIIASLVPTLEGDDTGPSGDDDGDNVVPLKPKKQVNKKASPKTKPSD